MTTIEIEGSRAPVGELVVRVWDVAQTPATLLGSALLAPAGSVTVGKGALADLRVLEPTVSDRHVEIEHRGDSIMVADLCSKNGTTLLGHRIGRAEVAPGARLGLGRALLELAPAVRSGGPAPETVPLAGLVGRSLPMLSLAERVRRYAKLSVPLLIRGESGTGKELVARAAHDESRLGKRPFVAINAATFSRELAESELFGHRRGAFTGAIADRRGAFREAHGGTLFIDELAQLTLDVQAKLLRVVEEGVVRPVGADGVTRVEVRLVAATCEPLENEVDRGRFRRDLYERLAVCVVRVPPLRERLSDLPELTRFLLTELRLERMRLTPGALAALASRSYPGNVRELRSILLLAAIASGDANLIDSRHVESAFVERGGPDLRVSFEEAAATLRASGGNQSHTARVLGVPRTTLRDLLARGPRR
jgi:DNA-binding NtrC family response regulator